jgi:deazaflavin-dependent oxidoreductase (nitroreductase family)
MRPPKFLIRAMGRAQAAIYRASGGRLLTRFGRVEVLLLTTTGRRSGKPRTAPLLYIRDGDAYVVVGSQGGHDTHPGWVLNLRADPHATVQIGAWVIPVAAEDAPDDARDRLWRDLVATYPSYAEYRERTARRFPIVVLRPEELPG